MSENYEECLAYLEQIRWGEIPKCPYCESTNSSAYKKEKRYHCNNCFTSYSVTVGTLFHKTHLDLQIWFKAIHLILGNSGKITVRQLAKELGVNKNTANHVIQRINRSSPEDQKLLRLICESK